MIPKKIHYCWFGGNPLPKLARKCIASWKKYCPEYEIIEWNELNFDINCCEYVKEAYEAKKWAFVSDYARFKILYEQGGVYLDVDVELIRSIDDIVSRGPFMGEERIGRVAPGLGIGTESGTTIYKKLIDEYHRRHFYKVDGTPDLTTVVEYTTDVLKQNGYEEREEIQQIEGILIYPVKYFNPYDLDTGRVVITDKTYSIHHYAASWVGGYDKFRGKVYRSLRRVFGEKFAEKVKKVVGRKQE